MSSPKKLEIILESDSSDGDESVTLEELKEKISKLEETNLILQQEKDRAKWRYQEKVDKFQKEVEGEGIIKLCTYLTSYCLFYG